MSGAGGAERLRALVGDYYHGLLTFDSYREQRGKLLDALQLEAQRPKPPPAEAAAPDVTQSKTAARPSPPPPPAAPAPAPSAAPAASVPPQAAVSPRANRMPLAVAAGAVAIGLVVFVAYRFLGSSGDAVSPPDAAAPGPVVALAPGAALLEQFTQRNSWAPDSLRNLGVTWNSALTEEQRQEARASPSYSRFGDLLRRRVREEEALSGAERSAELESLVTLARELQMPFAASLELASPASSAPVATPSPRAAANAAPRGETQDAAPPQRETPAPAAAAAAPPSAPAVQPPAPPQESSAAPAQSAPVAVAASTPSPVADAPPSGAADNAAASGDASSPCSAELYNTRRPYCRDALRAGGEAPALVVLPAGEFVMGGDQPSESPRHDVRVRAMAMSVNEVSFADFSAYCTAAGVRCPENPWSNADFPVVLVSWDEAVAYAEWLSAQTGQRYRLPSEAEWEYAARARTQTQYPFGDVVTPIAARSSANGPVDSPLANSDRSVNRNEFRLYHMIGNVREWVADGWQEGYAGAPTDGSARPAGSATARVVRGGAYNDGPRPLRSAARTSLDASASDRMTGFRVVRDLSE